MRASRLISLGSVNVDVQARAERWPEAGETLLARDFLMVGGGKAANVAYLARLLQADVQLVAHVGDDALADYALQPLRDLGIDFLHVKHVPNTATAVAMIVGRPDAQSSIVLANNANDAWTDDDHETVAAVITAAPAASVLVTDFEIPTRVVQRALHAAVRQGHKVIADPSPADRVPLDILPYVDYLTPNAGEAMRLTGIKVDSLDTAFAAAQCLHDRGAGMVLASAFPRERIMPRGLQPGYGTRSSSRKLTTAWS